MATVGAGAATATATAELLTPGEDSQWPVVRLDSVAEVRLGRQRSPKHHNGTHMRPYIRAANVGWGGLDLSDVKTMNFTDDEMSTYRLEAGDLVLGEASGSAKEVGKPAIWTGEIGECGFQNTLIRVRPRGPEPRYLLHFFRHQAETGQFAARSRGVGIYHLGRQALADLKVPLPPIEEQRRIAAVLDQADELRAKRRAILALLDTLTESIFLDMFGGSQRHPWPRAPIKSLSAPTPRAIRTGPFGSDLLHSEFVDEGIAVLGIDNAVADRFEWGKRRYITPEKYERLKQFTVHPGDVLITIMGTCGRSAVVPEDIPVAINTKHLCCITLDLDQCLPEFLWSSFRFDLGLQRQLGRVAKGAVMPGLNKTLIESADLSLPPLDRQLEFVDRLLEASKASRLQAASAAELDNLFAALQHRAFRGEL